MDRFQDELNQLRKDTDLANESRARLTPTLVEEADRLKTRGLYGPESKVWEVSRESGSFFGGGRAVFLQLAHPFVAAGVQQHSKVADDIQVRVPASCRPLLTLF